MDLRFKPLSSLHLSIPSLRPLYSLLFLSPPPPPVLHIPLHSPPRLSCPLRPHLLSNLSLIPSHICSASVAAPPSPFLPLFFAFPPLLISPWLLWLPLCSRQAPLFNLALHLSFHFLSLLFRSVFFFPLPPPPPPPPQSITFRCPSPGICCSDLLRFSSSLSRSSSLCNFFFLLY